MLTALCIVLIIFTLFSLPIFMRGEVYFNVFENRGYVKLFLFFFLIYKVELSVRQLDRTHNNLVVKTVHKEREYHLNADKNDKKSIINLLGSFIPYVDIIELNIDINVGKKNDAFFTVIAMGVIRIVMYSFFSYLKCREKIDINENFSTEFNSDLVEVKAAGIFSVTIADIIYSAILHLIKKSRKNIKRLKKREVIYDIRA